MWLSFFHIHFSLFPFYRVDFVSQLISVQIFSANSLIRHSLSNTVRLMVTVISTCFRYFPLPITVDVVQFLQPFDGKQSIGLGNSTKMLQLMAAVHRSRSGAHSNAFYADAMTKETCSRPLPLGRGKRALRKRSATDLETSSMLPQKFLRPLWFFSVCI